MLGENVPSHDFATDYYAFFRLLRIHFHPELLPSLRFRFTHGGMEGANEEDFTV